jgi:NAD(P)-dependent dehydrogenase (short-subunit alcohol dehydrogenase family)
MARTIAAAAAIGAVLTAKRLKAIAERKKLAMKLCGKVVLITGGSHGLGIALARGFSKKGSRIVICAKNESELAFAKADLAREGAEVLTVVCDVSDALQVESMVQSALARFGRIDVLVNNAGVIQVGPFATMTMNDFEGAMDVMFGGTVHTTLAALPHLRGLPEARIVNITSVGGKVSIPHLLPYCCAKFACVAFSEGLRSELEGTGVKVVTIAPGLMRTGSHLNAVFHGAEAGEAAWFSVGASVPFLSMSAEKAARQIIAATETGAAGRILGVPANILSLFHGLFPGTTSDVLGVLSRALPEGSHLTERGGDTSTLRKPLLKLLTVLGRRAARRLLQPDTRKPIHPASVV